MFKCVVFKLLATVTKPQTFQLSLSALFCNVSVSLRLMTLTYFVHISRKQTRFSGEKSDNRPN